LQLPVRGDRATLLHGGWAFLRTQPTDMRTRFYGLFAATRTLTGADPLSGRLIIF